VKTNDNNDFSAPEPAVHSGEKSMKAKVLPLLMLAALSTATLAATPPNTLVVVQSLDDIVSLDPAEANELSSIQTVPSLYQRLVQADRDDPAKVVPVLAESWQGDAAAKTLTIKLRPQALFASGNPLTADDVIFSYSRAVKMNKSPAFILNVLGWQPDNIDAQLKKIDDHSLQLSWTADVSPAVALNILSTPIASIVDGKTVQANIKDGDYGNAWLKMHSAGSGPFKMRVYQPHQAIVLDANPTSPGSKPLLKSIIIKSVPDSATRRLLIQQGDADVARELGPDQTVALKNQPGVKVLEIPSAEQNYLVFNTGNTANPLLKNPAFWQAARYLIDYQGITKDLLKDQYFVHQSFLPVGLPGALKDNPFSFDPAKAKAILAKAGITNATLTLDVENKPPFITIAQAMQASFAEGGVKLELLPAAGSQVYSRVRARQHQAAIRLWIPDYFDAHSNASAFAYNDGKASTVAGLNGWQIPQLSQQTLAAVAEADPVRRTALYTAMQQELQRNSPYVFIDQAKTEVVLRANVKGYQQGLNADMVYYDRVSK
jgi:peptide/nickel transport system substrate-binding protein